ASGAGVGGSDLGPEAGVRLVGGGSADVAAISAVAHPRGPSPSVDASEGSVVYPLVVTSAMFAPGLADGSAVALVELRELRRDLVGAAALLRELRQPRAQETGRELEAGDV